MFQLGKNDGEVIDWEPDLIFEDFKNANITVQKLFEINGSIYSIKQIGGFNNEL